MKKILLAIAVLMNSAVSSMAFDVNSVLNSVTNKNQTTDNQSTNSTTSQLGSLLGGVLDNVLGTKDIKLENLVGTWTYSSPAISLESDNALQKIGGAAATGAIEQKLAPYYQKAGVTDLVLTVNQDYTFTMKMRMATMSGVIEKEENGGLIFNFKAFNKINLGKVQTMASLAGNSLTLTFDVSKLKSVVEKVATVSNNQTFKSVSTLLSAYEGIYAGFKVTKTN